MKARSFQISAVLPAFNEEGNLERSVTRLDRALAARASRHEIIVVNDGSRDGTAALLEQLSRSHPRLRVVTHPTNLGYGATLRSGFRVARYPWIFVMDSDNQFNPEDIELLLAGALEADIVAGYRKKRRDPVARRLNAWAFFTLVSLLFGRLARDVNCAFKLIRRDLLTRMELRSNGALINTELFVKARGLDAQLVEVPVEHYPRTTGKQTGANPRVIFRAFAELLAFRLHMTTDGGRSDDIKKAA